MDINELRIKIEEMLNDVREDQNEPYLDEYEQGCNAGRVDVLENVLMLMPNKINI